MLQSVKFDYRFSIISQTIQRSPKKFSYTQKTLLHRFSFMVATTGLIAPFGERRQDEAPGRSQGGWGWRVRWWEKLRIQPKKGW